MPVYFWDNNLLIGGAVCVVLAVAVCGGVNFWRRRQLAHSVRRESAIDQALLDNGDA